MPEPSISVTPIPNTELKKITLKNDELTVVLLNYGARLHQIFAPDNKGHLENVLLSYDELSDVLTDESFFGATVGPVAGRIRNATWGNHQLEKWMVFPILGCRSVQKSTVDRRCLLFTRHFFRLSWSYHSNDHVSANCE